MAVVAGASSLLGKIICDETLEQNTLPPAMSSRVKPSDGYAVGHPAARHKSLGAVLLFRIPMGLL